MAAATTLSRQVYDINAGDLETVKDPGNGGTIRVSNKGFYRVEIVSAGAETRALEAATALPPFTEATLAFKTDGGDVTVTAGANIVVLNAAGQVVTFITVPTASGNVWAIKSNSKINDASVDLSTAPVNVTGAKGSNVALASLLAALVALGLITDSTTT